MRSSFVMRTADSWRQELLSRDGPVTLDEYEELLRLDGNIDYWPEGWQTLPQKQY